MKVATKERKVGRKVIEEATECKFFQVSPLFGSLKSDKGLTENMSPIWAVCNTTSSKKVNMKLDVAIFEVPLLRSLNDVKLPTPSKFPLFNVIVQTAVNTRKIEKDEILYFSTMVDDESESETESKGEDK